jgi:hypothetical protein
MENSDRFGGFLYCGWSLGLALYQDAQASKKGL